MASRFHQHADAAMMRGDVTGAMAALEQAVVDDSRDFQAWLKLAALRKRSGMPQQALEAVNAALDANANDCLLLLLKASLHEQLGQVSKAAEIYAAALFQAENLQNPPPPVEAQLAKARQFVAQHRAAIEQKMEKMEALDARHTARATRFLDNAINRRPVFHQEPTHYRYPGLADIEYFDFAYPALLARLRDSWREIRQEFEALYALHLERATPYVNFASGQPMAQWAPLNKSPKWNVFHLLRYGEADPINAPACPRTLAAFAGDEQATMPGLAPNLLFSMLAPRTRIPPHHGVANFRCLVHLPLIVPSACAFRVGSDTRPWVEGEPWIFDDSIEHEAWNESDDLRVILIGDVWRPELDEQDRDIVRDFICASDGIGEAGAL